MHSRRARGLFLQSPRPWCCAFVLWAFWPGTAMAEDRNAVPPPGVTVSQPIPDPVEVTKMKRAGFSGKRLVAEILASAVVGAAAAHLVYSSTCGPGEDCAQEFFLAAGAQFAATPLAAWGVGTAFGGKGRLWHTYALGAAPVAVAPLLMEHPENPPGQTTTFRQITEMYLITALILPVTSAVIYELSSWGQSQQWFARHAPGLDVSLAPVYDNGRVGLQSRLSFVF